MYSTIEFLLSLPEDERQQMEVANNYPFTEADPAPVPNRVQLLKSRSAMPPNLTESVERKCEYYVIDEGTVEAAERLCKEGFRPAVMNFAHGYNCGGGFEHAGGSQEEDIFRNTSAFLSLWPHRRSDDGPGVLARGMWIGDFDDKLARKEPFYPHTEYAVIYSPHIRIVRSVGLPGNPLESAEDINKLHIISLLTCAAQDCGRNPPFRQPLLKQKCRSILLTAANHGHEALVLGAFGCGYFRNPPSVVAATFKELLQGEFAEMFRKVVFAIPGSHNGNFKAFAGVFPSK